MWRGREFQQQQPLYPETSTRQYHECPRWRRFCVCIFTLCVHPVFASARRPAAVLEWEGRSVADTKKPNKKVKIDVGAQTVIGRQNAAAGPLHNISHQTALHRRCQRLPELSEDASRALWRDPGKNNISHWDTRHEVQLCPTTWTKAVSDWHIWPLGTITGHSPMRSGAVKQPPAICKAIVETYKDEMFVLPVRPDEWRALARPTTERHQVLLWPVTSHHILLRSPRFTTAYYVSHKHPDCHGRFFDSLKICPGIHGNHGLSRLLTPSPHVVSRPSRFGHSGLKHDCRGCRDPSVNVA